MRIRLAVVLGVALLAACAAPTPTPIPLAAPSTPSHVQGSSALSSGLHVLMWSDYIDESLLDAYERKYGVDIQVDTYASNKELLARLKEGGDYDVVFPSDYMVAEMISLNMLAPLDMARIPNARTIMPHLRRPPYDPEGTYSVPYVWGVSGLLYHVPTFADSPPDSWAYLFDPDLLTRYSGQGVNVLENRRELIGAALKYLGYSVNETNEKHLLEARDVILKAKPFWKEMNAADYVESLVIPGKVVLSQARSREGFIAVWHTLDRSNGHAQWAFAVPREGSTFWADAIAIPASSARRHTAEHFINFLLDPKNQAANTNYTYFAAPSEEAKQYIDAEILADPGVYPPADVLARTEWIADVGPAQGVYNRVWIEVTSW